MSAWARVAAAVGALALVLAPQPAQAHSGTYDLKYVDGSNVELVTFNTHSPVAEMDIVHNIRLYDLLGAPVPYEQVRVEFHSRDRDLTAGRKSLLHAETLPMLATNESMLTWRYPVQGDYTLKLRFMADGHTVSKGQMAVAVGRPTGSGGFSLTSLLGLAGSFVLGVLAHHLVLVLRRRRAPAASAEPDPVVPPAARKQRAKVPAG
ncbi:MAG: hypothetical protein ABWX84_10085 [Nocardioides sp.]